MGGFKSFEEIESWQKSRVLIKEIYSLFSQTKSLHREFILKDQIIRASLSVMSNIAEGFSRQTDKEFAQFLNISKGSCSEVKSIMYVLIDTEFINQNTFNNFYDKITEIEKLLSGLISYLRK